MGLILGLFAKFTLYLFVIWPLMLINAFTQYIEYFDAILVGIFFGGLTQMYELMSWQWGIAVGVVAAVIFLALFHLSKIAMWILTVLCSLLWANWLVGIVTSIFPDNKIAYWIGYALIFVWCIWQHRYAKVRPAIERDLAAEEKAAQLRAAGYESPEETERHKKDWAALNQRLRELERIQDAKKAKQQP